MRPSRPSRRPVAVLAAVALSAGLGIALPATASAAAEPRGITSDPVDYFDDVYPSLRAGSVFETVTYERFEYLLDSEGTFAFLIGGPADPGTQAVVSHIDAVAQQYGLETIYNFDPRLDGKDVDVRTSQIEPVAALWDHLVSTYLDPDGTGAFNDLDTSPHLIVYSKDGTTEPVVAAVTGTRTAAELAEPEAAAAYEAEVAAVLGAASAPGSTRAELSTVSLFDFYTTQYNSRHAAAYRNDPSYGGPILTEEDADFRIQQITYPELINILESDGEHVLFFGGTWCHNTRAVVKEVNRQAALKDVEVVYNFDLRLDGLNSDVHIRDSNNPLAHLYGDLVEAHLPNLETQYRLDSPNANHQVAYHPGGDTGAAKKDAKKLQVPFLLQYSKGATADGAAAPVTRQWIQRNEDGTHTEYMTEWWFVNELPGYTTDPEALATSYAFAKAAIAHLDAFFTADAAAPAAPDAPSAQVSESDVTVTWSAPQDNGSAITGYTVTLSDGQQVHVGADTLSHTFTGLAAGRYSATVAATNALGTSPASPASATVTVVRADDDGVGDDDEDGTGDGTDGETDVVDPATVTGTIAVTGDLTPGGTIHVDASELAADAEGFAVELHSDPVLLATADTDAEGAFSITATIPAATSAGTHSVIVLYEGAEVAQAEVLITAAVTDAGAAPGSGGLAATGADGVRTAVLLVVAALAVTAGALVTRRARLARR